jgi:hypothetical protein
LPEPCPMTGSSDGGRVARGGDAETSRCLLESSRGELSPLSTPLTLRPPLYHLPGSSNPLFGTVARLLTKHRAPDSITLFHRHRLKITRKLKRTGLCITRPPALSLSLPCPPARATPSDLSRDNLILHSTRPSNTFSSLSTASNLSLLHPPQVHMSSSRCRSCAATRPASPGRAGRS